MSTEDKPERPREKKSADWHRARAKRLRANGFTKMAEEHEQIAQLIERQKLPWMLPAVWQIMPPQQGFILTADQHRRRAQDLRTPVGPTWRATTKTAR